MQRNKSFESKYLLYLVASPIGNLKEMNPRAIEVISDCDLVACEDTRVTKKLLGFFNISKECLSLHEHNEQEAGEKVIELIKEGKKVAYMSDAGYPAISDPGDILVKKCIDNGIAVSCVNGGSALLDALVTSRQDKDHFLFYGFLDAKKSAREKELNKLKDVPYTIILYEAPHRIEETLHSIYDVLGDREITLARELTKLNEECIYGKVSEFLSLDFSSIIGEIVLVIEGYHENEVIFTEEKIKELLLESLQKGRSKKDAVEYVSKTYKIKKNLVYDVMKTIE
ncbi:MAG: 16S rRNA (cytidine(1402)-2'-O)-methyltransferase [Coprobacillus sp.]|nr:16S rRNA (cytidine(1402)-2'-O)-methyltransferase [Coprobacillus sp.]